MKVSIIRASTYRQPYVNSRIQESTLRELTSISDGSPDEFVENIVIENDILPGAGVFDVLEEID